MSYKTERDIKQTWKFDAHEPIISILCIAYNHEQYIRQAIESFLHQKTIYPFEIIIGEDCSSDNTLSIIREYETKYPSIIKLISSEKNVGMQKNFIRVLEASRGEFLAVCEADDYWHDENKLQVQIEEMNKYPNCNMSFHPANKLHNGKFLGDISKHCNSSKIFSTQEIILGDGGFCPSASLMFRKKILENFPKELFEKVPVVDYFLQILGSLEGGALYINRTMSIYRMGDINSWSHSMNEIDKMIKWSNESLLAIDELYKYMRKHEIEISQMKSRIYYVLAIGYLKNGLYAEYKSAIEKCYYLHSKSFKYSVFYFLRRMPIIPKTLLKLKHSI